MRLTIRTDGGSRGNPGPAAAGVVICEEGGKTIFAGGFFLGNTTNNVAEYSGVLRGLELAMEAGGTEVEVFSDSELLVRQINGDYRVKSVRLKDYYRRVMELIGRFERVRVRHVYRHDNQQADDLVNQSLDTGGDIGDSVLRGAIGADDHVSAADKRAIHLIDLRKKARFEGTGPYREVLCREKHLVCEMVCLKQGQSAHLSEEVESTLVTVMRGRGVLTAAGEKTALRAGIWLQVRSGDPLAIEAHGKEGLVLILTRQR